MRESGIFDMPSLSQVRVAEFESIPVGDMVIYNQGTPLSDDMVLGGNVAELSTLTVEARMLGGKCCSLVYSLLLGITLVINEMFLQSQVHLCANPKLAILEILRKIPGIGIFFSVKKCVLRI